MLNAIDGFSLIELRRPELLRSAHISFRFVFFLNWSRIVPPEIVNNWTCINFHCTDLRVNPMRGGGPIENLLLRGYTETVISAYRMTEEIDAGPVYGVSEPVSLAGTKAEILDRFVDPVVQLIKWIVEEEPEPVPQWGEPVIFKRLPKAEYEAFWAERGGA